MRRLAINHGPFEPGLFTMLSLLHDVSSVYVMYTGNVLKDDAFLWELGLPYDSGLANVTGRSRARVARNFPTRPGRLPHGCAGRLWQEFGHELCRMILASEGQIESVDDPLFLNYLCEEIDRNVIEGLDLLEPAVRQLAGISEVPPSPETSAAETPSFIEVVTSTHRTTVLVPGFAFEILEMKDSSTALLWRGTWQKSAEAFAPRALSILRDHIKEAIEARSESTSGHLVAC
jgi:hypothetical protein